MAWPKLPGPAFWAILVTAVLLTTVTMAGYAHDMSWDTISDMITRSDRLRNTFALFTGFILVCQGYYVVTMYRRWATRAALYKHHSPIYFSTAFVTLGYLLSFAGSVGFAIVSTDISEDEHLVYAGIAFTGIYMYLLAFGGLASYYHNGNGAADEVGGAALWPMASSLFLLVPVATSIVYAIDHYYFDASFSREYAYVWEFIFVISMLGAALSLYVNKPGGSPGTREHQEVHYGPITLQAHAPGGPLIF